MLKCSTAVLWLFDIERYLCEQKCHMWYDLAEAIKVIACPKVPASV